MKAVNRTFDRLLKDFNSGKKGMEVVCMNNKHVSLACSASPNDSTRSPFKNPLFNSYFDVQRIK